MTEIPSDIEDAADEVYAHTSYRNPKLRAAIALAIFAERERCAKIAETMPGWLQSRDVAGAIRRGDQP